MSPWRLVLVFLALLTGVWGVLQTHWLLIGAALVLAALAFRGVGDAALPADARAVTLGEIWAALRSHPFPALGAVALAASVAAALMAGAVPHSSAAVGLWLAALGLTLVGAWLDDGVSLRRGLSRLGALGQRQVALEALMVVLLTGLAFGLRSYNIEYVPATFHGDEGETGLLALAVLEGKDPPPPFGTGWFDCPTLFHYLQAGSMALFGKGVGGLRMLSVIVGTLCVPLVYGIGRVGWGRLAGAAAAWLTAVSHLHIHYSRFGSHFIESTFSMVLSMLLLALARERLARRDAPRAAQGLPSLALFVGAGLVMGLSQYTYYASRLLPVIAVPLLLFLAWERRLPLRHVAALWLAAFIAMAPLAYHYVLEPQTFLNRMVGVRVFSPEGMRHTLGPEAAWPEDLPALVEHQVGRTLQFFIRRGDGSGFYVQEPAAFDLVAALLFWLGLALAAARLRRYHEFSLVAWFGLGAVLGGVVTIDPPSGQRLQIVAPAVFLLAGLFADRAWRLVNLSVWRRLDLLGVPVLAILGLATLGLNLQTYFVTYPRIGGAQAPAVAARQVVAYADRYDPYLLGAPHLVAKYGAVRFIAHGVPNLQDLESTDDLAPPSDPSRGLLVVALPHRQGDLEAIQARYPGGQTERHYDTAGRELCTVYRIPVEALAGK
ncbi:MAG: phospholipid carrier-dependent glycosyltransferase [Chloroflexi bacterium]|nr:phospholipid carrier-dependent glycosyltransferase [Chloroflexota bacterium]